VNATMELAPARVSCDCGCGRLFQPTRPWHRFFNDACRVRAERAMRPRAVPDTTPAVFYGLADPCVCDRAIPEWWPGLGLMCFKCCRRLTRRQRAA
jgi:hypothetical protein